MIQFQCDYTEGAHPAIMQRLLDTNMEQTPGYGYDHYCKDAAKAIKEAIDCPNADIHFFVGGTQTNTTIIASLLRPFQGVISPDSGHISVHETGAIEHTGHKVITLPNTDGKITAEQIAKNIELYLAEDSPEHIVEPAMVYISFPTEIGTIYSRQELTDIHAVCQKYEIPLFIDGARLGYGLASPECDITLQDVARLCDVFYIGGTKGGSLFGEAVVFTNPKFFIPNFRHHIKQQGAMLAKGRLLGVQFLALFTDNLYLNIAGHANTEALRIRDAFRAKGCGFLVDSPTNQQFPIVTNAQMAELAKDFSFSKWQRVDSDHIVLRFCTSWATRTEDVDQLIAAIEKL